MKPRNLAKVLLRAAKTFPALVLTGPRQSGKTTLLKHLFLETHRFVSLENLDIRARAKDDPSAFLEHYKPPVILDEIQYAPELLSYIKTQIDEKRKPGQWILTGSQNFVLMQGISQSLAGRAAILSLLPFSYAERLGKGEEVLDTAAWLRRISKEMPQDRTGRLSIAEAILRGNYPEIASKKAVDRQLWCGSYISTYLERDVRNMANVGDLSHFEKFLRACAIRTGQILNLSEIAKELGISVPTAKRWLSVLQAGYQIYLLEPYHRNLSKRLVKSPKLYFMDTGLASYLLGIHDRDTLLGSPSFGHLFETWVITDLLKRFLHAGQMPSLYFYQTLDGLEIDAVIESAQKLYLFEIKSTMTIFPRHAAALQRLLGDKKLRIDKAFLISQAEGCFKLNQNIRHLNYNSILQK